MNKYIALLLCVFLVVGIISCSEKDQSPNEIENPSPESINDFNDNEYLTIRTKVDSLWSLIDSTEDDLRITANRIVKEVKWSGKGNAAAISAVESQIADLDKYRYTQESIPSADQLDIDFVSVDVILSNVVELANTLPDREQYLILDDLIADIYKYQSGTYTSLLDTYNTAVFEHNRIVREKNLKTKQLPAYMEDPSMAL
jgi:hypothetical protein